MSLSDIRNDGSAFRKCLYIRESESEVNPLSPKKQKYSQQKVRGRQALAGWNVQKENNVRERRERGL